MLEIGVTDTKNVKNNKHNNILCITFLFLQI